jgi:hypothetical protein
MRRVPVASAAASPWDWRRSKVPSARYSFLPSSSLVIILKPVVKPGRATVSP